MDRGRRQRGFKFSEGDWTCSDSECRNVNFARRDRCNLCNKPRDDRGGGGGFRDEGGFRGRGRGRGGGRGGAGGRGGGGGAMFAPEDWDCPKCGNVNWARRDRCFRCDASKGSDRGRKFDDDDVGYAPDREFDDGGDFKPRRGGKFGGRSGPLYEEDECGPVNVGPIRNGSGSRGSFRGRGGGSGRGFGGGGSGRGFGGGGRGFSGRGGGRGRGGGFRGRDRSRSPLDRF